MIEEVLAEDKMRLALVRIEPKNRTVMGHRPFDIPGFEIKAGKSALDRRGTGFDSRSRFIVGGGLRLFSLVGEQLPETEVPVRAVIVFVNPGVQLDAGNSSVPAFYGKKVKAWLSTL